MRLLIAALALLAIPALAQDIRVIDGDMFEMDGEVIRLWGIDAPELGQTCNHNGELVDAGGLAKAWLENFVSEMDYCTPVDRDRWGRMIARCFGTIAGDQFVEANQLIVLVGLAWDYRRSSGGAYAPAQAHAQSQGLGVWQWQCIPPWEWRQAS